MNARRWDRVPVPQAFAENGVVDAFVSTDRYELIHRVYGGRDVWELRSPTQVQLAAQLELPGISDGAPLSWANRWLRDLGIRRPGRQAV